MPLSFNKIEDWKRKILEKLKVEEKRTSALQEIRDILRKMPYLEAGVAKRLLSAPDVYDYLDESGESHKDRLASDILSICMVIRRDDLAQLHLFISPNDLSELLKRSIMHPFSKIRALTLTTILKELEGNTEDVMIADRLILQVLEAVRDDDAAVNGPAIAILSITLELQMGQNFIKEALLHALNGNGIIKCRIYEIAVNLAKRSAETMEKIKYILDDALSQLIKGDTLIQINILKILPSLAEKNHALLFLEQRRVFDMLNVRVMNLARHSSHSLLIPAIFKFFGNVATSHPRKVITGYPHLVSYLFRCSISYDPLMLPVAYDILDSLMKTQEGSFLMQKKYMWELKKVFGKRKF